MIQNRFIHHLGSGLLNSARSPSHTCPVVSLVVPPGRTLVLLCAHSSQPQAMIETAVMPMM